MSWEYRKLIAHVTPPEHEAIEHLSITKDSIFMRTPSGFKIFRLAKYQDDKGWHETEFLQLAEEQRLERPSNVKSNSLARTSSRKKGR